MFVALMFAQTYLSPDFSKYLFLCFSYLFKCVFNSREKAVIEQPFKLVILKFVQFNMINLNFETII